MKATSPEEHRQPRTGKQTKQIRLPHYLPTRSSYSLGASDQKAPENGDGPSAQVCAKPHISGNWSGKCILHFKIFKRHPFYFSRNSLSCIHNIREHYLFCSPQRARLNANLTVKTVETNTV